jgi:hypothetical protein
LSATSAASIDLVRRSSAFCPVRDPVERAFEAVLCAERAREVAVFRVERAREAALLRAPLARELVLREERVALLPVVLLVATWSSSRRCRRARRNVPARAAAVK